MIFNKYNEDDHYCNQGIGEVWESKRPPNSEGAKIGVFGGHYCGTKEDFAEGAVFNPSLPPVVFTSIGLPKCCPQGINGAGGIGIGGKSVPKIFRSGVALGGIGIGGYSTPTVGKGCTGAVPITFGVSNHISIAPGPGTQWYRFAVSAGIGYRIRITNPMNFAGVTVTHGPSCGINPVVPTIFPFCWSWINAAAGFAWITFNRHATLTISCDITPGTGTCP